MSEEIQIENQLQKIAEQFNIENNLIQMLFLIGIQESGEGFRQFTKEKKIDLIELGGTTVLSPYGYYQRIKTQDQIPYYIANPNKNLPDEHRRELLLKKGIINYFSKKIENHE